MNEDIKTTEELFNNIPQEVKSYIYSDSFIKSLKDFLEKESLNSEDISRVKGALYGYLAQAESEEGLLQTIRLVSKSIESSQRIIDWVKKEVTDKVLSIVVDAYIEDDEDDEEEEKAVDQNKQLTDLSPKQTFSNIQNRLDNAVAIAPITRDYSVTRASEPIVPKADTTPRAPSMDIYREVPEK